MTTLTDLIPILLQKTEEGKIDWEQLSTTSYFARFGDLTVESSSSKGDTFVALRNEEGTILEGASYGGTQPPIDGFIKRLFDSAKRRALKIDDAINILKDSLEKL